MIVTLEDAKNWLRVDIEDDDNLISSLIEIGSEYLKNATGKTFDETNKLARLFVLTLVTDWYENREYELSAGKATLSSRTRYTIHSLLLQLEYGENV